MFIHLYTVSVCEKGWPVTQLQKMSLLKHAPATCYIHVAGKNDTVLHILTTHIVAKIPTGINRPKLSA